MAQSASCAHERVITRVGLDLASGQQIHDDKEMMQEPTTDTKPPDRGTVSFWTRVRQGTLLMVSAVVMYLLLTGPLLWSYSKSENETLQSFVRIYMTLIVKLENHEKRDYYEDPQIWLDCESCDWIPSGRISLPRNDSWWLAGLKSYWNWFGESANSCYQKLKT